MISSGLTGRALIFSRLEGKIKGKNSNELTNEGLSELTISLSLRELINEFATERLNDYEIAKSLSR